MIDVVGLVILAPLVALASLFVPETQMPKILWVFVYMIFCASALFVWHHPKAPQQKSKWLYLALLSVGSAMIWFGVVSLCSALFFQEAEPLLSKTINMLIAMAICPGLTLIALAGWMRCFIQVVFRRD